MYCTQCGFKLEDDMKMCPICGAEVEKSAPSVDGIRRKAAGCMHRSYLKQ